MTEQQELTATQQANLLSFLGFGNPLAPYVFLGMEEGLTLPPSLLEQLVIRSKFQNLMDLATAGSAHPDKYLSGARPPIQPTWNLAIRILLATENNLMPTNDQIRFYQRDRLARSFEASALLELMPLPCSNIGDWPYKELFRQYPSRQDYLDHLLDRRIDALSEHLAYGPRLVVAYGARYWQYYRRIFPKAREWSRNGIFEIADSVGTRVILTPHFTARTMNGQWQHLVSLAIQK